MPEFLHSKVQRGTALDERYLAHAAHQSMSVYLADWEKAYGVLGRRLEELRAARDDRLINGFPTGAVR